MNRTYSQAQPGLTLRKLNQQNRQTFDHQAPTPLELVPESTGMTSDDHPPVEDPLRPKYCVTCGKLIRTHGTQDASLSEREAIAEGNV